MGLWDSIKDIGSKAVQGIGKAVGGIPSAIIGGALDLGGSYLQNKYVADPNSKKAWQRSEKSAQAAFDRSYEAYKRRYQDTTEDLIAAGINPILVASSGFKVGTSPQSTAAQSIPMLASNLSPTGSAQAFGRANLATAQAGRVEQEKEELVSRAKRNFAQANEAMARIYTERYKRGLLAAQEKESYAKINKLQSEFRHLAAKLIQTKEMTENTRKQRELIKKQVQQLTYHLKMLKKSSSWYKGAYGDFLGWIKATMGALNLNLGVIGGLKR